MENWTEEQEFFLVLNCRKPDLFRLWEKQARDKGWPLRSAEALKSKIRRLREEGTIISIFRKWEPWTAEEDFFLIGVCHAPNLYRLWAKHARDNGWPPRSANALKARMKELGEKRRIMDGTDGWISARGLLTCLGMSGENADAVSRWIGLGLKAHKEKQIIRIHLVDFVNFALGVGLEEVAKSVEGDRLAITWLLRCISDWKDEKPPKIYTKLPQSPEQIYAPRKA